MQDPTETKSETKTYLLADRYGNVQEGRTVTLTKLPCGHFGLMSMYPDANGNTQCTECANKMRGK